MMNTRRMTIIAVALILIGGIGSLFVHFLSEQPQAVHAEKAYTEEAITNMQIDITNGEVQLLPSSDERIHVRLTGTAKGQEHLTTIVDDDTLQIDIIDDTEKKWFSFGFYEPAYELMVYLPPRQFQSIQLAVDNGSILTRGIEADVFDLHTINGQIELDRLAAQQVSANTVNGKLSMQDVEGQIVGSSENGMISLHTSSIDRPIELTSTNGSIAIQSNQEPRNVSFDVHTANGIIDLFGKYDHDSVIGQGEHRVALSTQNGSIHLTH